MYFVAAAPLVWVVILISSLINCPGSKITMSNFFERCRQQAVYNAIGMRANIDDLIKRKKNRFGKLANKINNFVYNIYLENCIFFHCSPTFKSERTSGRNYWRNQGYWIGGHPRFAQM